MRLILVDPLSETGPGLRTEGCSGPSLRYGYDIEEGSPCAIEPAVLDGLGDVLGGDGVNARQVGDGAGHPQQAIVGPRREAEAGHGQA